MGNVCAIRVGRLMEVAVQQGYRTSADVDAIFDGIGAELARLRGTQVVIAADWRHCPLMSDAASERAVARMKQNNGRVDRAAALASRTSPVTVLQYMRLIHASEHPHRRLFFEPNAMIAWLAEVLTECEIERLHEFVGGPAGRVAAGE